MKFKPTKQRKDSVLTQAKQIANVIVQSNIDFYQRYLLVSDSSLVFSQKTSTDLIHASDITIL